MTLQHDEYPTLNNLYFLRLCPTAPTVQRFGNEQVVMQSFQIFLSANDRVGMGKNLDFDLRALCPFDNLTYLVKRNEVSRRKENVLDLNALGVFVQNLQALVPYPQLFIVVYQNHLRGLFGFDLIITQRIRANPSS